MQWLEQRTQQQNCQQSHIQVLSLPSGCRHFENAILGKLPITAIPFFPEILKQKERHLY